MIPLENIYVILVEPLYGGNIGSVARAMKNMGLRHLVLVNPKADYLGLEAKKMAVSAFDIVEKAEVFSSLEEALADFTYLAATTTRDRKGYPYKFTAKGISNKLLALAKKGKVGIMFGREDKGLFNEELSRANDVITIPTSRELSSLNLAQAVLITVYELFQSYNPDNIMQVPVYNLATVDAKEKYFEHLEKTLEEIGFFHSSSKDHVMYSIRDLLNRSLPSDRDIRILRGILRQLEWFFDKRSVHD